MVKLLQILYLMKPPDEEVLVGQGYKLVVSRNNPLKSSSAAVAFLNKYPATRNTWGEGRSTASYSSGVHSLGPKHHTAQDAGFLGVSLFWESTRCGHQNGSIFSSSHVDPADWNLWAAKALISESGMKSIIAARRGLLRFQSRLT